MSRAALAIVTALVSLWSVAAEASEMSSTCLFGQSPRRADVTTRSGHHVELFDEQIRIDGETSTACDRLPAAHPTAIAPWEDGFAVAFRDAGVMAWQAGSFHPIEGLPRTPVRALASTGSTLWIGTATDGLWRVASGVASKFEHRALGSAGIAALRAEGSTRLDVALDPAGWLSISGTGAVRTIDAFAIVGCFRAHGARVSPAPPGHPCEGDGSLGTLPSGHVTALAKHGGDLAVGTFDHGVFLLHDGSDARPLPFAPRNVNALLDDGDRLYIGATNGLYVATASGNVERAALPLPSPHVNGLALARDGTLWIATSHALVGWSDGNVRVLGEREGLPSSIVYAVTEAGDGAIWVGTAGGVARLGKTSTRFTSANGQLPQDWVTSLLSDGAAIYAGTYDHGVVRLDVGAPSRALPGLENAWINPNGLVRVRGHVWAATLGDGLIGAPGPGPRLPSDDVTAVLEDGPETWIGTRSGLARLGRR